MIRHTMLALAAVIVAAVIATPAQANFVSTGQADNTKISLTTTGTTKITLNASFFIQCNDWTLTGSITPANRSTLSIPVTGVVWSKCTATIFGLSAAITIGDTGLDWTASVGTSAGATSFNITLTTPTSISVTASGTGCTVNISKQTFATGIGFTNSSHSLTATVTGISFTSTNCAGAVPPSGTTGAFSTSFSDKTVVVTA